MAKFLGIGFIPEPLLTYPWHQHDHVWEIVIYTHGKGVTTIGDKKINFRPGTIICMPPAVLQHEISVSGYRNIFVAADEFPSLPGVVPVFQDSPTGEFRIVAEQLLKESSHPQKNNALICQNLFDVLLLLLDRWSATPHEVPAVAKLRNLLFQNIGNAEFEVILAMSGLGYTPDHLRKLFFEATGQTPSEYLTSLRVKQAQQLMQLGGLNIKTVASRVGIEDPYYFSRVFKKVSGVSPTAFLQGKEPLRARRSN